jgi:hypothetical protein
VHRLNLTIDEALYEQARAFSFVEKKFAKYSKKLQEKIFFTI